eukprot:3573405-Rhodomonas_salina.3
MLTLAYAVLRVLMRAALVAGEGEATPDVHQERDGNLHRRLRVGLRQTPTRWVEPSNALGPSQLWVPHQRTEAHWIPDQSAHVFTFSRSGCVRVKWRARGRGKQRGEASKWTAATRAQSAAAATSRGVARHTVFTNAVHCQPQRTLP